MQKKGSFPPPTHTSLWDEEGSVQQIAYSVVRHATGKSGPVRIQGLALTRTGDTVSVRPVNLRGQLLQQCLEVPWRAAVLRQLARVLTEWADQAEEEEARLQRRLQKSGEGKGVTPA